MKTRYITLHFASPNAPFIMQVILIQHYTNPCTINPHGCTPYYLYSNAKKRNAFCIGRHELGAYMGSLEKANVDDPLTKETILEKEKRMCSKKNRRQRRRGRLPRKMLRRKRENAKNNKSRQMLINKLKNGSKFTYNHCNKVPLNKAQIIFRLNYKYYFTGCETASKEIIFKTNLPQFYSMRTYAMLANIKDKYYMCAKF